MIFLESPKKQRIFLLFFVAAPVSFALDIAHNIENVLTDQPLFWSLAGSFIAGILTSFSPCVYPLIPITLGVMGARRYDSHLQGFIHALCYVFGMTLVYSLLGVIFASLGLVLGSILQNPFMLIAIAIFFILMALSAFGLFKIILPENLTQKLALIGGQGYKGAFSMGLVAGILAAPCTSPVLGFILTLIASHQNVVLGIALMSSFSLGMGLPFLVLGTFSSALLFMPKSGQWMNYIKVFLGTAMLAAAFYYGSLASSAFDSSKSQTLNHNGFFIIDDGTKSETILDEVIQEAQKQGRPILIDFFADWCAACIKLDEVTFKHPQVIEALSNYVLIKVDGSRSSKIVQQIQNKFAVTGLPTLVLLHPSGTKIEKSQVLGFIEPVDFLKKINTKP